MFSVQLPSVSLVCSVQCAVCSCLVSAFPERSLHSHTTRCSLFGVRLCPEKCLFEFSLVCIKCNNRSQSLKHQFQASHPCVTITLFYDIINDHLICHHFGFDHYFLWKLWQLCLFKFRCSHFKFECEHLKLKCSHFKWEFFFKCIVAKWRENYLRLHRHILSSHILNFLHARLPGSPPTDTSEMLYRFFQVLRVK